jgi:hypothetical protein
VSGTVDPGADPRLRFDEPMLCECGGAGVVTDAADAGDGWWLVTWWVEHRPGCRGLTAPSRAFLMDAEAFAAGDVGLPGVASEEAPVRPAAGLLARCEAIAVTTGRSCRLPAALGGLCVTHYRMARP